MYFFDLDGTLLDSNRVWLDIDIAFLNQQGIPSASEDYTEYVTYHSFQDAARHTKERYGLSLSENEILSAWFRLAVDAYATQLPLKPGARQVLERLNENGEQPALLTSCMPELCSAAISNHDLSPLLKAVITPKEVGLGKDDPALYLRLAEQFGISPEECTLVDDSPYYCDAAKRAGWHTVGVVDLPFSKNAAALANICEQCLDSLEGFPLT
ncbi:MAG: HAD-IA family hydrolase [Clostridium sp.]|nr:HAD-IA family hydrolase [Clostridium sp.]